MCNFFILFMLLLFNLHSSTCTDGLTVLIDNIPMEFNRQNLSTNEYYYKGCYFFSPGFPFNIHFVTTEEYAVPTRLLLISESNKRTFVNTTLVKDYVDMILTEEHNNTYLECSYSKYQNDSSLRLYMYVNIIETAKDNPNNITLDIIENKENGNLTCNVLPKYTIFGGEDTDVIVNHNSVIANAWCYDNKRMDIICNRNHKYIHPTRARLPINVTRDGKWMCRFFIARNEKNIIFYNGPEYEKLLCDFIVHVRPTNGLVISINRIPVETKRQDLSTIEYDYVGYYYFQPGAPIYVQYIGPINQSGIMTFKLRSAPTSDKFLIIEEKYAGRHVYMKLTEEHNNTSLDCRYASSANHLTTRVYLYINKRVITEKESLIITVNGERLQSNPTLDTRTNVTVNYLVYDMTYINDTNLTITCERHAESYGQLELTVYKLDADYKGSVRTADGATIYTSMPSNKLNNESEVTCSLKRDRETSVDYVIKFMRTYSKTGLILTGLTNRNILVNKEIHYGNIHMIKYQYTDGDTLNLNCSCTNTSNCVIIWNKNGTVLERNSNIALLTLDHSYNKTTIKCTNNSTSKFISIKLFYQNITTNSATTTNTSVTKKYFVMVIPSVILALAAIVLIVLLTWVRRRRQKQISQHSQLQLQSVELDTFPSSSVNRNH